ncbi:MAG: anhydro-N-acetylmuramic acid kinase [Candidatus Sulfotelmatobacter sp.]
MTVAGVMSGTSADGINVALVRFGGGRAATRAVAHKGPRGRGGRDHASSGNYIESGNNIRLLGHAEFAYPKKIRVFVLSAMNDSATSVADLARLNFLLGELYSDAILATQRRFRVKADLVGCHGQTLYHQGQPAAFLGHKIAATWQTGEAAIIAARTGVPVISDFRPADMAAGGKGAPLVPFLDYMLFRDAHIGRIVQNIGGIANLTAIPANAAASDVIAFDTGPGNMVIDAIMEKLFAKPFDRGGNIAASGKVLDGVVSRILRHKFFRTKPPKTAGREEFGRQFVEEFLRACENCRKEDAIATATALTAKSIADAVLRHVLENASPAKNKYDQNEYEMIVSGGGAKNSALVAMLKHELAPLGIRLRFSDEFGVPSEAKEAMAFALLAHETWHRRPSSLPSATGAKRAAVLGKITYR